MYEEEPKARDLKPLRSGRGRGEDNFVKRRSQPLALVPLGNECATKALAKNLSKSDESRAWTINNVNFCSHALSTIEDTCRIIGPLKNEH
jgi:hypothetical protein